MTLRHARINCPPEGVALRKEDEEECLALGMTPDQAMKYSFGRADASFVVWDDEGVVAYWGYRGSALGETGYVWMLSTPEAEKCPIAFGLHSKELLDDLLEVYPKLLICVSSKYTRSKKWLKWLGFKKVGEMSGTDIMQIERD